MSAFDHLIHAPKRLRVMTILHATDTATFAYLQERIGLTAPDLSKQMATLADAGYVTVRKSGRGPGSTTWFAATRKGRKAYEAHLEALRELLDESTQDASERDAGEPQDVDT